MKSTTLGALTISNMQLGAMYFGSKTPEKMSRSLLDRFVDAGGNFIDTSNNYSFWVEGGCGEESETVLGRWLKTRGRRDDLVIATKVGAKPSTPEAGLTDVQGLSPAVIEKNVDQSLARLGTDYIDLYYAHVDDRKTPLEETLAGFDRLIKAGKVREIACSNYVPWRIEEARQTSLCQRSMPAYVAVQARHSYFQPKFGADFGIQSSLGPGDFGMEHSADAHLFDYRPARRPDFRIISLFPAAAGRLCAARPFAQPVRHPRQCQAPRRARLGRGRCHRRQRQPDRAGLDDAVRSGRCCRSSPHRTWRSSRTISALRISC